MKTSILILLCALVAMATAGYYKGNWDSRQGYGFRRTPNGIEAAYNNAGRQKGVNRVAHKVGAGIGTAQIYGVPGTGNYFNRPHYSQGYDVKGDGYYKDRIY